MSSLLDEERKVDAALASLKRGDKMPSKAVRSKLKKDPTVSKLMLQARPSSRASKAGAGTNCWEEFRQALAGETRSG